MNSNFALTLGYLNRALNNPAQGSEPVKSRVPSENTINDFFENKTKIF